MKIELTCDSCGAVYSRYRSQIRSVTKGRYCSKRCVGMVASQRLVSLRKAHAKQVRRDVARPELTDGVALLLNKGRVAIVSTEDSVLDAQTWSFTNHGYAQEYATRHFLHRVVMQRTLGRPLENTEFVDHRNRNKLDNRRSNLRLADHSQNAANSVSAGSYTSPYKGVSWSRSRELYATYLTYRGKKINLGRFEDPEEAAWMYDQFASQLHGEFAVLNFEYA